MASKRGDQGLFSLSSTLACNLACKISSAAALMTACVTISRPPLQLLKLRGKCERPSRVLHDLFWDGGRPRDPVCTRGSAKRQDLMLT